MLDQGVDAVPYEQIERMKENIQPSIAGHSASRLVSSKEGSAAQRAFQDQCQTYERQLLQCTNTEDRFDTFYDYVKYVQQQSINVSTDKWRNLLERALDVVKGCDEYYNDRAAVRCWLWYAQAASEPREVFTYMMDHGIGANSASFYQDFADYEEFIAKNDNAAESLLVRGIQYQAKPVSQLEEALNRLYQRRKLRVTHVIPDHDEPFYALPLANKSNLGLPSATRNASQKDSGRVAVYRDGSESLTKLPPRAPPTRDMMQRKENAPFPTAPETPASAVPVRHLTRTFQVMADETATQASKGSMPLPVLSQIGSTPKQTTTMPFVSEKRQLLEKYAGKSKPERTIPLFQGKAIVTEAALSHPRASQWPVVIDYKRKLLNESSVVTTATPLKSSMRTPLKSHIPENIVTTARQSQRIMDKVKRLNISSLVGVTEEMESKPLSNVYAPSPTVHYKQTKEDVMEMFRAPLPTVSGVALMEDSSDDESLLQAPPAKMSVYKDRTADIKAVVAQVQQQKIEHVPVSNIETNRPALVEKLVESTSSYTEKILPFPVPAAIVYQWLTKSDRVQQLLKNAHDYRLVTMDMNSSILPDGKSLHIEDQQQDRVLLKAEYDQRTVLAQWLVPARVWPFYMLHCAHQCQINCPLPLHCYIFKNASLQLIQIFSHQGNLLNAAQLYHSLGLDETLVWYYSEKLIHILIRLRQSQLVHGQLSADCCWVQIHDDEEDATQLQDWLSRHSLLITGWDNALNLKLLSHDTRLSLKEHSFLRDPSDVDPFMLDSLAAAEIVHGLLFGSSLQVDNGDGILRLSRTFKALWQVTLWERFFATLLNAGNLGSLLSLHKDIILHLEAMMIKGKLKSAIKRHEIRLLEQDLV